MARRVIATQEESNVLVETVLPILGIVLPIMRNLIIVGLVFNLLDAFLPYLILSESVAMLGFLPGDRGKAGEFLKDLLNSKLDLMAALRVGMSG